MEHHVHMSWKQTAEYQLGVTTKAINPKSKPRKRCMQCKEDGVPDKWSYYVCTGCNNTFLCRGPCFTRWHARLSQTIKHGLKFKWSCSLLRHLAHTCFHLPSMNFTQFDILMGFFNVYCKKIAPRFYYLCTMSKNTYPPCSYPSHQSFRGTHGWFSTAMVCHLLENYQK